MEVIRDWPVFCDQPVYKNIKIKISFQIIKTTDNSHGYVLNCICLDCCRAFIHLCINVCKLKKRSHTNRPVHVWKRFSNWWSESVVFRLKTGWKLLGLLWPVLKRPFTLMLHCWCLALIIQQWPLQHYLLSQNPKRHPSLFVHVRRIILRVSLLFGLFNCLQLWALSVKVHNLHGIIICIVCNLTL